MSTRFLAGRPPRFPLRLSLTLTLTGVVTLIGCGSPQTKTPTEPAAEIAVGQCDDSRPCPEGQRCRFNECGPECLVSHECEEEAWCSEGRCVPRPACGPHSLKRHCDYLYECVEGQCVRQGAGR